ncbi:MAG: hypothetical protein WDW38_011530 [Sanguina aurantia]
MPAAAAACQHPPAVQCPTPPRHPSPPTPPHSPPAASAGDALPPEVANLLLLAENLNEALTLANAAAAAAPASRQQAQPSSPPHYPPAPDSDGFRSTNTRGSKKLQQQQQQQQLQQQQANGRTHGVRGGGGGRRTSPLPSHFEHANRFGGGGGGQGVPRRSWGSGSGSGSEGDADAEEAHDQDAVHGSCLESGDRVEARGGWGGGAGAGEEREAWEAWERDAGCVGGLDAVPVSLAELAGRICAAFPAEVTSLVDMSGEAPHPFTHPHPVYSNDVSFGPKGGGGRVKRSVDRTDRSPEGLKRCFPLYGKKYLHQGVVALPFVALPRMASTLQLALSQGQSLSVGEAARNSFRPSQLLVAGTVHKTASTAFSATAAAAAPPPASQSPATAPTPAAAAAAAAAVTPYAPPWRVAPLATPPGFTPPPGFATPAAAGTAAPLAPPPGFTPLAPPPGFHAHTAAAAAPPGFPSPATAAAAAAAAAIATAASAPPPPCNTPLLWHLLTTDHSSSSGGGGGGTDPADAGGGAAAAAKALGALGGMMGIMFARRAGTEIVTLDLDVAALPVAAPCSSLLPGEGCPVTDEQAPGSHGRTLDLRHAQQQQAGPPERHVRPAAEPVFRHPTLVSVCQCVQTCHGSAAWCSRGAGLAGGRGGRGCGALPASCSLRASISGCDEDVCHNQAAVTVCQVQGDGVNRSRSQRHWTWGHADRLQSLLGWRMVMLCCMSAPWANRTEPSARLCGGASVVGRATPGTGLRVAKHRRGPPGGA